MKTIKYITFLFLILSLNACYEDFESTTIVTQEVEPGISYRHDVSGIVTDTSGTPLTGIKVSILDRTEITNDNGRFLLSSVEISEKGSFISLYNTNYINSGIRIYPQQSLSHEVSITMVPNPTSYLLSNDMGGTVETQEGLEINIDAQSILQNDEIFMGQYEIQIFYINPKNENNYNKQLRAHDVEVDGIISLPKIEALSMAFIKITNSLNQTLQIDPDKPLKLKFPTPSNFEPLPSSTTLLSFDEAKGTWIDEGIAQLKNAKYEASLKHLSWWTVANIRSTRSFCFKANTDSTSPSEENIYVLNTLSGNHVQAGRVEYGKEICFPVPSDEDLHLSIYNYCLIKLKEEIYPSSEIDLNEIIDVVEITEGYSISVSISNCLANPLPGNYKIQYNNGNNFEINADSFNIQLGPCFNSPSLNIVIEDLTSNSIHSLVIDIYPDINDYAEEIGICGNIPNDQVLVFGDEIYTNCQAKVNPEEVIIYADDPAVLLGFDYVESGITPCRVIHSSVSEVGTASINKIGDVGEFVTGTFEVNAVDGSTLKGSFKALRKQ